MQTRRTMLIGAIAVAILVAGSAFVAGANGRQTGLADGPTPQAEGAESCPPADAKLSQTTEIATAKLIIEYNATDQDFGVHGAFDDDGWRILCVFDPTGRLVLRVSPDSQLRDLTMAGIFFESREPPVSEFSFADLKTAFPEGGYTVQAESFDGKILVGSATFTHDVPAAPTIDAAVLAEDPQGARKEPVPLEDLEIRWQDVTETVDGGPVQITGYEVIVTKEGAVDPNGFSQPIYDVHVPPTLNSLRVPVEFLEPNTVYELEVLALETSGNQTITVGFFKTA
jgi:hypothetical protein